MGWSGVLTADQIFIEFHSDGHKPPPPFTPEPLRSQLRKRHEWPYIPHPPHPPTPQPALLLDPLHTALIFRHLSGGAAEEKLSNGSAATAFTLVGFFLSCTTLIQQWFLRGRFALRRAAANLQGARRKRKLFQVFPISRFQIGSKIKSKLACQFTFGKCNFII